VDKRLAVVLQGGWVAQHPGSERVTPPQPTVSITMAPCSPWLCNGAARRGPRTPESEDMGTREKVSDGDRSKAARGCCCRATAL